MEIDNYDYPLLISDVKDENGVNEVESSCDIPAMIIINLEYTIFLVYMIIFSGNIFFFNLFIRFINFYQIFN